MPSLEKRPGAPKDERVELPRFSRLEHPAEGLALAPALAAGLVIDELFRQDVSFSLNEPTELPALVLFGLPSVACGDAQVECGALFRRSRWVRHGGGRAWEGRNSRGVA